MSALRERIASWQPGRLLSPDGRTRLVVLAGIGSRTGDAERNFYSLARYLARRGGYDSRADVLEASYRGTEVGGSWRPSPYQPGDTRQPLEDLVDAVAGSLDWYRMALPEDTRFLVVGYSLGGVCGLDGAALAVARDREAWHGRLTGVVTLASPVLGTSAGALVEWAWLATNELDPLGAVGPALVRRWQDPAERERVRRRAAFLRAMGACVLTLADPDDAVVRPEEALLPLPGQNAGELLVRTEHVRPGTLGHGAILDEPAAFERVLAIAGPQERSRSASAVGEDPIEAELRAMKARLRAEGRLS